MTAAPQRRRAWSDVTIVTNERGECVAVLRTDRKGQILSVIWEKPATTEAISRDLRTMAAQHLKAGRTKTSVSLDLAAQRLDDLQRALDART